MPPRSATRPIRPSSASISRTRWPFPSPPIAGLQDIAPIVANWWVISAVCAPIRAAAAAASQPAWPPPITTTSNRLSIKTSEGAVVAEARGGVKNIEVVELFHVKHWKQRFSGLWREVCFTVSWHCHCQLFADAEITENHVQDIFHVDAAGQTTKGTSSDSQLLGQQILVPCSLER